MRPWSGSPEPPEEGAFQKLGVETVGLGPPVSARHGGARPRLTRQSIFSFGVPSFSQLLPLTMTFPPQRSRPPEHQSQQHQSSIAVLHGRLIGRRLRRNYPTACLARRSGVSGHEKPGTYRGSTASISARALGWGALPLRVPRSVRGIGVVH